MGVAAGFCEGGTCDIGVVGLAVMGENLAVNLAEKGFAVAAYEREPGKAEAFARGRAKGMGVAAAGTPRELVGLLKRPRRVLAMIKAGEPVDALIESIAPLLEPGDAIIDGGNSHYLDTARRVAQAESMGFWFIGMGVSGGEEGARKGPALMPGGSLGAWPGARPVFEAIAARAEDGAPCCAWMGGGGAGHFAKTVHNGIEYGDMQAICEAFHASGEILGMSPPEIGSAFTRWNEGELESYLIKITGEILLKADDDGKPLVDKILDAAGQKGTGIWASAAALDLGAPLTLVGEAVGARLLSSRDELRHAASAALEGPRLSGISRTGDVGSAAENGRDRFLCDMEAALLVSRAVSYAQGFELLRDASEAYGWGIDLAKVALSWRGGCIIRSAFLSRIASAFEEDAHLPSLLLSPYFRELTAAAQMGLRRVIARAASRGVPMPVMSSALAYYDGIRCRRLPASLLQAQRDYFGAHGYERVDCQRGTRFHTDWQLG